MTEEQFIQAVAQEQGPLRQFLCALCGGDSFRADDLAQEALIKAWLSFERFEGRAKFSTWLFRIAYNCFYDYKSRAAVSVCEPLQPSDETRADDSADASSRFAWQSLYLAIDNLSEAEKTVTLLFYMSGKTIKEISDITGIHPATVRSHLFRARTHLRNYLQNDVL